MNYELIYKLVGVICLAVTWIKFDPFQNVFKKLLNLDGKIYGMAYTLLSCAKCVGFWLGLIITTDLIQASIISVGATYLSYLTSKI